MRQLLPAGGPPGEVDPGQLACLYAYPPAGRPWVRANMVASVDGAASVGGRSGGLSGRADREIFGLLRSLADVILVGAGTARAEHYRPARPATIRPELRAGRSATPPIAIISGRLDLDPGVALFTAAPPDARTIVITCERAPHEQQAAVAECADVVVAGAEQVDLKAALEALRARGYRRVLTEGGPHLLGQLAAAGLLDELCLTISPLLAGPGPGRIVGGETIPGGLPLTLGHLLADEGFLLGRYTVAADKRRLYANAPGDRARPPRGPSRWPVAAGRARNRPPPPPRGR